MIDDPRMFIKLYGADMYPNYSDILRPTVTFDKHDNLLIYDPSNYNVQLNLNENDVVYDEIERLMNSLQINDLIELDYKDILSAYAEFNTNDVVDLRDFHNYESRLYIQSRFTDFEHIIKLQLLLRLADVVETDYKDLIGVAKIDFNLLEDLKIKIRHKVDSYLYANEQLYVKDSNTLKIYYSLLDKLLLDYKDNIKNINISLFCKNKININEYYRITYEE